MNLSPHDYRSLPMHLKQLIHMNSDRAVRTIATHRLRQYGLTLMQWILLGVVESCGNKGCTMTAASASLQVTTPQVTALSEGLLELKYISVKADKMDRRTRRMNATRKGKAILEQADREVQNDIRNWLSANTELSADHMNTFFYVLDSISKTFYDKVK